MNWMPRKLGAREHHKCEGHKTCPYWAYSRARRTPTSDWHWYCTKCLQVVAKCGWEIHTPPRQERPTGVGQAMAKALCALPFLVACQCIYWQANPSHHYNLDIEGGFTGKEYTLILQGADRWRDATDGEITFGLIGYSGDPSTITIHGMTVAEIQAKYGPEVGGECTPYGEPSWIDLSNDIDSATFEHVVEHELGHSLGLKHTGPGTVMCDSTGCSSEHITCADVRQFCQIWGDCDADHMTICRFPPAG